MANGSHITKLNISTNDDEEQILRANNYLFINTDLNGGTGKNRVFLWYKKECGMNPVTRIQFSFNDSMKSGLDDAAYELVDKNLNVGTRGDPIYLWYYYGSGESDIPIVDVKVSKDAEEEPAFLHDGWERLGCDLNRNAGGNFIYLWVKREKPSYICEITATVDSTSDKSLFEQGFTRVDEDTNRGATGATTVFLWYRRLPDMSRTLTALNVSTSSHDETLTAKEGFDKLDVNLNQGTSGKKVLAWYTNKGCEAQIKNMVLLVNPGAWTTYQKAGVNFISKSLNEGNNGRKMYLAYK
ncbi:uncharacterized protein LOC132160163 [Carassius carassius]|uniref:uncharacterized protein LOC132160163 n=1 Tax=Carassius carassius TaxID=217509 RepID=UPI0028697985|nr:uncharacterized protein LOC132160163 [Carassius carassius]